MITSIFSSPVPSLPRNSQSSPFQRSQSFRHSPSPDRQGGDFLNVSRDSAGSGSRVEELEVSIQEKNDIIQRLSSELEKVGREMDQMGVKLQEVQNNNLAEYSMVDQLKQLQETIRLQDQKLAHKDRFHYFQRLNRFRTSWSFYGPVDDFSDQLVIFRTSWSGIGLVGHASDLLVRFRTS